VTDLDHRPAGEQAGGDTLVAATEKLDERFGGTAVIQGGLGVARLRPRGKVREQDPGEAGDEAGEPPVPVDPPALPATLRETALAARDADRRPIIPPWLRDRAEASALARWLARYFGHVALYHLTRLPKYAAKLLMWAPRGLWLLLRRLLRWWWDAEAAPLRVDAVERKDAPLYLNLDRQRKAKVRHRGMVLLACVFVAAVLYFLLGELVLWQILTPRLPRLGWPVPLWLLLAVAVLGRLGVPSDRRVTDVATVKSSAPPKLTADVVTKALRSLGVAALNPRDGDPISYVAPITRDGPGWRAEGDLAFGATVADVMENRHKLSGTLRRPLGCIWPEVRSDQHEARLVLWVGDQDMARAKPVAWPFAARGVTSVFTPIPFGVDPRGRGVSVPLIFESVLIGAKPRMGKTFALRVIVLGGVLHAIVEMHVFELKGTGDLSAVENCCHAYASGADDEAIEACMSSLRYLYAELNTRAATIRKLPKDLCPENKVTPELAEKRSLGLHPIMLAVDECQELFVHPEHGAEAARLCEAIIKRGPALGIIPVFATQRPDAKSLPTGVSANIGIRFCLRVMGQLENDMVLGTSSYRNGIRATTFTAKDRGIGYLVGVGDDPIIVRTAYIDAPEAERIAQRARAMRENAGLLSGHALGEAPTPAGERVDVLADLAAVLRTDEKAWTDAVLAMLAELRPAVYGSWNPRALAAALKPYRVKPAQVWLGGENRQGYTFDAIAEAMARRELEGAKS
jgi:S-DNA-T family DNA segregation ATPase FtsK/SpoIIIE